MGDYMIQPVCVTYRESDKIDPIELTRLAFQTDQTLMSLPMPGNQSLSFKIAYDNQIEYPGSA